MTFLCNMGWLKGPLLKPGCWLSCARSFFKSRAASEILCCCRRGNLTGNSVKEVQVVIRTLFHHNILILNNQRYNLHKTETNWNKKTDLFGHVAPTNLSSTKHWTTTAVVCSFQSNQMKHSPLFLLLFLCERRLMSRCCAASDLSGSLIWMKCRWQAAEWFQLSRGDFTQKGLLSLRLERVAAKDLLNDLCHERVKNNKVGQSRALCADQSLPSFFLLCSMLGC